MTTSRSWASGPLRERGAEECLELAATRSVPGLGSTPREPEETPMRTDRSNTVVVGVDGSRASLAALTLAITDAAQGLREVEVVTVWAAPAAVPAREGGLFMSRAARRRALRVQTMATTRATRLAGVRVPITGVLLDGDPAKILVQASAGASQLVLGAPRSGTPDNGPTASVTQRCLAKALCPVLVVPSPADGGAAPTPHRETDATDRSRRERLRHVGA
jgi:nucleotide-binding universal stress UspA family protein